MAYFFFKLVRMYQNTERAQAYLPVRKSLTTFAVLAIVLILLTIINAIACLLNFDKGLKPYVMSRKVDSEEEKSNMMEMMPDRTHMGAPPPTRMTID